MMFTHQCRHHLPQSIDAANGSIGSVGEEGHGPNLQRDQEEKKTHYEDVERYSIILSNALPTGNNGERKRPHERAMVIMSTSDNSMKNELVETDPTVQAVVATRRTVHLTNGAVGIAKWF